MVFHLWTNAKALGGQQAFEEAVLEIHRLPYLPLLEAFILLPLAFHALYGVKLAFEGRSNLGQYTHARNWMYTLQRFTGLVALLFLGYHLWQLRFQTAIDAMAPMAFYPTLCAHLSSTIHGVPIVGLVYILGVAACVFHLANGLWGFCVSWGLLLTRRAQRSAALVFGLMGLLLFLLGINTTLYFATGARSFLPAAPPTDRLSPRSCADLPRPRAAALAPGRSLPGFQPAVSGGSS
jgi:succinate dehydrogenase / fumarate reductase cytochrome b subunit